MKFSKVQFDSMAFQEWNGTCGMKPECFEQNLTEKSGTDRDLKWDEIYFVLFCFLNWYRIFQSFQTKRNKINNLDYDVKDMRTYISKWQIQQAFGPIIICTIYSMLCLLWLQRPSNSLAPLFYNELGFLFLVLFQV